MKSAFQIKALLSRRGTRKPIDFKNIRTLCTERGTSLYYFFLNKKEEDPKGLTTAEFIDWFENGFGDGEAVLYNGKTAIVSCADTEKYCLAGYLTEDGKWVKKEVKEVPASQLSKLTIEKQLETDTELSRLGLEYSFEKSDVTDKYVPKTNEGVIFWNAKRYGSGIVRSVNVGENEIELYCYYDYTNDTVGYSMHEKDVITFHEYHFIEMGRATRNRMNTELGKHGKVWKSHTHKIEQIPGRAIGKTYWYITDRIKLKQGTDSNEPTSRKRFAVGNYFTSVKDGMRYVEKIQDILRDKGAE